MQDLRSLIPSLTRRKQQRRRGSRLVPAEVLEERTLLTAVIYGDSLDESWQNWSWSTNIDFANESPVASGQRSIEATFTDGWGGVYFRAANAVATGVDEEIGFKVYAEAAGQLLNIVVVDGDENYLDGGQITPVQGQWTEVIIDLEDIGEPTDVVGLYIQEFTGNAGGTIFLDDVLIDDLEEEEPPPVRPGPAITIDSSVELRTISDDIYGLNFADEDLADDIGLTINRWGGNATSRYNYQVDATNLASDYFFENYPSETPDGAELPSGSTADAFVQDGIDRGGDTIITVGMLGYAAKDREIVGSYPVSVYGDQQSVDPWRPEYGNGVDLNGNNISNVSPLANHRTIDEQFTKEWVSHLVSEFGTAAEGGVGHYALDNEPMLWNSTHRDVHEAPASFDEVFEKGASYAAAIKDVDPSAQVMGPTSWGWTGYFYSALDAAGDGAWWENPQDRNAHDGKAFIPWYLEQMAAAEETGGERLLDYLDIHYYPQDNGVALSPAGNSETQATRLRSTRSLWDPTYTDATWIDDEVQLIPRMREWIDDNYPGTKLAITEYDWGANEHINGAVTQADVLGIFGREGVDLATKWAPPEADDPAAYAFRMFRNYDGTGEEGGEFGDLSVQASTADVDEVSVFASTRDIDGALTVVLVNKSLDTLNTPIDLAQFGNTTAEVYTYSRADLSSINRGADLQLVGGEAEIQLPGYSITLLEFPATDVGDVYVVTTAANDGTGSLREALEQANEEPGVQTITFDIAGTGTHTIGLTQALPRLTDAVVIDATTQAGYSGSPVVTLDGSAVAGAADGFRISAEGTVISGLAIGGFGGDGIDVLADGAEITNNFIGVDAGGSTLANKVGVRIKNMADTIVTGNVLSGNRTHGVQVVGSGSINNTLSDNMIGTNQTGDAAVPNGYHGVLVTGSDNVVGPGNVISGNGRVGVMLSADASNNQIVGNMLGTDASGAMGVGNGREGLKLTKGASDTQVEDNVISANLGYGITVTSSGTTDNVFTGNMVGVSANGADSLLNVRDGVLVKSPGNIFGGDTSDAANVFSGSSRAMHFSTTNAADNQIRGNFVGTDASETSDLGAAIAVLFSRGAFDNVVGPGNVIANNVTAVRSSSGGNGNRFVENSIYNNDRIGIDLGRTGRTVNDAADVDEGSNRAQNSPTLLSTTLAGTQLTLSFRVDSTTSSSLFPMSVELFEDDGSGQGRTYLGRVTYTEADLSIGQKTVTINVSDFNLNLGDSIVATATDAAGNTSEFSDSLEIGLGE